MENLSALLYFIFKPSPETALEILLLGVIYTTIAVWAVAFIGGTYRLLKLTFFETFFASRARPFSVPHKEGKRILIVGDSTAVGAGARNQADTIAGRLAHDFPHAEIVNLGINGARTKDSLRALSSVANQSFELVIVSVGGNDVWHFTSLKTLVRDLRSLLMSVKSLTTGPVILLLYNNIGSSPIFPFFLRWILKDRNDQVHQIFRGIGKEMGIPTIELFSTEEENPFIHEPHRYFSHDGVHPSSEGYQLWYNRMWRLLVAQGFTF